MGGAEMSETAKREPRTVDAVADGEEAITRLVRRVSTITRDLALRAVYLSKDLGAAEAGAESARQEEKAK
ncbi:MAG TPA: hypothetical protein VF060_02825 [Trebonia sp.]